jgi:hypothetical protein
VPEGLQLSRAKGFRLRPGVVVVSRPSRYGNPFGYRKDTGLCRYPAALGDGDWEYEGRISADGMRHDYFHGDGRVTVCHVRYMTRMELAECYRRLLVRDLPPSMRAALGNWRLPVTVEDVRRDLAGRDLACWCPLPAEGQPDACHRSVLLAVANGWEWPSA